MKESVRVSLSLFLSMKSSSGVLLGDLVSLERMLDCSSFSLMKLISSMGKFERYDCGLLLM